MIGPLSGSHSCWCRCNRHWLQAELVLTSSGCSSVFCWNCQRNLSRTHDSWCMKKQISESILEPQPTSSEIFISTFFDLVLRPWGCFRPDDPDGSPPRANLPEEAVEVPAVEPLEPAAEAVEESAGVGTQLGLSKNWGIFTGFYDFMAILSGKMEKWVFGSETPGIFLAKPFFITDVRWIQLVCPCLPILISFWPITMNNPPVFPELGGFEPSQSRFFSWVYRSTRCVDWKV